MNSFQKNALVLVQGILSIDDIYERFNEEGIGESYLHFRDEEIELDIWIYIDEVAFSYRRDHVQCEKEDFDSPNGMLNFFAARLRETLNQKSGPV